MRQIVIFCLATAITTSAFAPDGPAQKVDQLFAGYDKPTSPGCSVGVVRDGKFVYRKSYGSASLELAVPLTPQSVFYMASVSKQFTAASIVLAAEQGYLSLDDDVRKYIPELPNYGHTITLRQMLHHTSGLRDFLALTYLAGRDISALASATDVLNLIARQQGLNNVPGDEFTYSNSNYFLLGVVVKRATKRSLAEFAAQNIFQPLGMGRTRFYDDDTVVVSGRVAAYDSGPEGSFLVDWSTLFDIVGSGGLLSTVDDLLLWNNNFYENKLGKTNLTRELESHGVLNDGNPINYGMGLWLDQYRGLPIVEHSGGTFGYRAELLRFPEQRFSVIALCNLASVDVEGLSRKVADIYLDGQFKVESTVRALSDRLPDPTPFAGTYLDPRTHLIYTFTVANGELMAWGAVLRRSAANKFYDLVGNPITFGESNGVMKARLDLQGETYFDGSKVQNIHLSEAALSVFAGQYRSDELDATYSLSIEQASLTLKIRDRPAVKLEPIAPNEFRAGDLGSLVFHAGANQHPSELTLYSQAARGIDFKRMD